MTTQPVNPILEHRLIEVISRTLHVPAAHIHPHTHLRDDLFLDQIDWLLLIAKLEQSLDVYLSLEEVESIHTIRDLSFIVRRHVA